MGSGKVERGPSAPFICPQFLKNCQEGRLNEPALIGGAPVFDVIHKLMDGTAVNTCSIERRSNIPYALSRFTPCLLTDVYTYRGRTLGDNRCCATLSAKQYRVK